MPDSTLLYSPTPLAASQVCPVFLLLRIGLLYSLSELLFLGSGLEKLLLKSLHLGVRVLLTLLQILHLLFELPNYLGRSILILSLPRSGVREGGNQGRQLF